MPRIERGEPANVVLVDLDAEWEVGDAGYESRSANCAFAGRRVTGRVRMTIAGGAVAYRERTFALGAVAPLTSSVSWKDGYILLEDGDALRRGARAARAGDGSARSSSTPR